MEAVLQAAVSARRSQSRPLVMQMLRPRLGAEATAPPDLGSLFGRKMLMRHLGRWDVLALRDARAWYEMAERTPPFVEYYDEYRVVAVHDIQVDDDPSMADRTEFMSWLDERNIKVLGRAIYTGDAVHDDVVETIILDAAAAHVDAIANAVSDTKRSTAAAAG